MAYGSCVCYGLRSVESLTGHIFIGPELCEQGAVLNAGEMANKLRKIFTLKNLHSSRGRQVVSRQTKKLRLLRK